MALSPLRTDDFSGLDLVAAPDEVGFSGAVDLLNVDLDQAPGRLRARDGYATFANLTNTITSLYAWPRVSAGTLSTQLLVGEGTRFTALSSGGATVASDATLTVTTAPTFVAFGSPTATLIYASNGTDAPRKWDGAAWTTPTATVGGVGGSAMPKGNYLALQGPDNRLVVTGFVATTDGPGGAASSPSHVYFSDAGNPESWQTTSEIQLTPGDGEAITGVCAWRELLFVFKRTKFFVFYGNSTDGSGNPVFNYRTVNAGAGAANSASIVSTPDGVYFGGQGGVYLTTGGPAQIVSGKVAPIFRGSPTPDFFQSPLTARASAPTQSMAWHRDRLYVNYIPATNFARVLIYDPRRGVWGLNGYDNGTGAGAASAPIPMASALLGTADPAALVFAARSGNSLYREKPAQVTDVGVAVASTYRSGFYSPQPSGRADGRRVIRRWRLRGSGTVTFGVAADDAASIPSTGGGAQASVNLAGPYPNYSIAQIGNDFSWQMSSSGVWHLDSIVAEFK